MYDIKNLNIWKEEPQNNQSDDELLNMEVSELNLSVRSFNCLKRAGCNTVGDILALISEDVNGLRKIRNLGTRSESEILECIRNFQEDFVRQRQRTASCGTNNTFPGNAAAEKQRPGYRADAGSGEGPAYGCNTESSAPAKETSTRKVMIKPARMMWDMDIEAFHLSNYALTRLRQSGIRQVRDLYATNPKQEPGWYAVRELFDRILVVQSRQN